MNKFSKFLIFFLALLIIVIIYGAIPFFSIPTLGQAVWASGFAESYVNSGWPSIYSENIGVPTKAPIVFGLPAVILQGFFIAVFNLHSADAYTLGAVLWLALALWGSIKFCQLLGANYNVGAFVSLIYLTLPYIWAHANYSMMSFGLALLPLYVYISFKFICSTSDEKITPQQFSLTAVSLWCISLLAVFMDGYSFMMFFSSCGIIWINAFFRKDSPKKALLLRTLPIILISGFSASLIYSLYTGSLIYPPSPLDFFRAWGVDIMMLLVPTKGVMWLWDLLDVGVLRTTEMYYGDSSVWKTTFSLLILIAAGSGFWLSRKHQYALSLLCIVLVGFYFSMGPSLKINSLRPLDEFGNHIQTAETVMPEEDAILLTGNAFFFENVPGFMNMRATYRWAGLMFTGSFGLIVLLYLQLVARKQGLFALGIVSILIISNIPNLHNRIKEVQAHRDAFLHIDQALGDLIEFFAEEDSVFFAPPGKNYIINYIVSKGNYRSFNIGGDKNFLMAVSNWSEEMQNTIFYRSGELFIQNITTILVDGQANYVVIPYFDMATTWQYPSSGILEYKEFYKETIFILNNDHLLNVIEEELYTIISLPKTD